MGDRIVDKDGLLQEYKKYAEKHTPYGWFNYQPIPLEGYEETIPLAGRNCFDRTNKILQHISENFDSDVSIVDFGSNLGFFVFEAAKKGYKSFGVDSNKKFIDVSNYLSRESGLKHQPPFYQDTLKLDTVENYKADICFIFSVLHHIEKKDRYKLLQKISNFYRGCYIEMDGRDFGREELKMFFWNVEEIAESNDRYGKGTRRRKTWYCSNYIDEVSFQNIKENNQLHGRYVFKKNKNGISTVVKKEKTSFSHTWLKTNISHEIDMYKKFPSRFFPKLIDFEINDNYRTMEIEYVEESKDCRALNDIHDFYKYLKENNLFIIDFVSDSFLWTENGLKYVDLESLFEINGDIQKTINSCRKSEKHKVHFDTYEKQINYLLNKKWK